MHRRTLLLALLGLGVFGLLSGCGSTSTVSGEVIVDGQPVDKGYISYVPADGKGIPITRPIQNGKYELRTVPGKKFVQISAMGVVGQRQEDDDPNAPPVEVKKERLPPRYNSRTELTCELKPGNNTQDWKIDTKAP